MSRAIQLVNLMDELLAKRPKTELRVVELGAIRSQAPIYREGDGYSTLHIAEAARGKKRCKITSVDLDTSVARRILLQEGLFDGEDRPDIQLVEEDALHWAKRTKATIDLLYIDTVTEAGHICNLFETLLPRMRHGSYIVIDDIDQPSIHDRVIAFIEGYIELSYVVVNRQLVVSVP